MEKEKKLKQLNLFSGEKEIPEEEQEEIDTEERQIENGFMLGISCCNCGARFIEQFQNGIAVPSTEKAGGEVLEVFVYDYEKQDEGRELGQIECPHCHIKEYLKVYFRMPIGFTQEWEGAGQGKFNIRGAGYDEDDLFDDDSAAIN